MHEIKIRKMVKEDVRIIHEIETLCFPDPWSEESLLAEVNGKNPSCYLVGEVDGSVVGYAGLWRILDEGHITNVAVHPDYRKRHIGELLVANLLKENLESGIRAFTLEVRVSNEAALRLYRKFGFEVAGRRKNYYKTEDAFVMWAYYT